MRITAGLLLLRTTEIDKILQNLYSPVKHLYPFTKIHQLISPRKFPKIFRYLNLAYFELSDSADVRFFGLFFE